jgi:succinyl-diaminopimelate desuccinylase
VASPPTRSTRAEASHIAGARRPPSGTSNRAAGMDTALPGRPSKAREREQVANDKAARFIDTHVSPEWGALVVAEPTTNRPLCGHKGALWLRATTRGVTAHGSMPNHGVNAVYAAVRAVGRLEAFDFNVARHPVMGAPTLNVGTLHGGLNVNAVPDRGEIGIDIRTIPGMRHGPLRDQIASYLGSEVALASIVDVESVWTDPGQPWMREVFGICADVRDTAAIVETAPYFTDASALTPALGGVPTVILGPGAAHMAHQTDEWCECAASRRLLRSMRRLIAAWCGLA